MRNLILVLLAFLLVAPFAFAEEEAIVLNPIVKHKNAESCVNALAIVKGMKLRVPRETNIVGLYFIGSKRCHVHDIVNLEGLGGITAEKNFEDVLIQYRDAGYFSGDFEKNGNRYRVHDNPIDIYYE